MGNALSSEGNPLSLTCDAGRKSPTNFPYQYQWFLRHKFSDTEQPVQPGEGPELSVGSLTYHDAGVYRCKVTSGGGGEGEASLEVEVQCM